MSGVPLNPDSRLSIRQWERLGEYLELAEIEYPMLVGFGVCKVSARILTILKKEEEEKGATTYV